MPFSLGERPLAGLPAWANKNYFVDPTTSVGASFKGPVERLTISSGFTSSAQGLSVLASFASDTKTLSVLLIRTPLSVGMPLAVVRSAIGHRRSRVCIAAFGRLLASKTRNSTKNSATVDTDCGRYGGRRRRRKWKPPDKIRRAG